MIAALREHFKIKTYLAVSAFIAIIGTFHHGAFAVPCTPHCPPSSLSPNPSTDGSAFQLAEAQRRQAASQATFTQAPSNPVATINNEAAALTLTELWAKWGSLLAICISSGVAIYTWRKDRRARRHSIEDDYWLRKVISPLVIEPMLKDVLEMIAASPVDCGSPVFSEELTKGYLKDYVGRLSQLAANTTALSLINDELASKISTMLDNIQDLLINYCFENESLNKDALGLPVSDRSSFQGAARVELIRILKSIKAYQLGLT